MKTMILTAAMIFLMTSLTVWATDDSSSVYREEGRKLETAIKVQPSNIIEFRVINPDHEKVTFVIYGEKNNKIFSRTLRNDDGIRFGCDMKDWNRGTYVCVIEKNGTELNRKAVTLK